MIKITRQVNLSFLKILNNEGSTGIWNFVKLFDRGVQQVLENNTSGGIDL